MDLNETGRNARIVSQMLDKIRMQGNLVEGIQLSNGSILSVFLVENEAVKVPAFLNLQKRDPKKLWSTEYLNRSLARVTENNPTEKSQITANGVKCQSFCVPEAYQHVSSLKKDENGNSKEVLIPGINTPLAWATASLFKAMNQCRGNIKELEKRKQHDNNVVTSEKMRSKLSR